ncbi:ABC transporter ATPase [Robiginitalea sp.]|nr:ABC transporter ATPase [Robiginitalea sp.]
MLVPFESLPTESRIWIYQSSRAFEAHELEELREALSSFLNRWTVHGADLHAGFLMPYDRFIIIGLDQDHNAASGCSIDASVNFIQELEQRFSVELLDRMNVTFYQGEQIVYKPLSEFRKMAKSKAVSASTLVFNNLVNNKHEFEHFWKVPASESWHSRFF